MHCHTVSVYTWRGRRQRLHPVWLPAGRGRRLQPPQPLKLPQTLDRWGTDAHLRAACVHTHKNTLTKKMTVLKCCPTSYRTDCRLSRGTYIYKNYIGATYMVPWIPSMTQRKVKLNTKGRHSQSLSPIWDALSLSCLIFVSVSGFRCQRLSFTHLHTVNYSLRASTHNKQCYFIGITKNTRVCLWSMTRHHNICCAVVVLTGSLLPQQQSHSSS